MRMRAKVKVRGLVFTLDLIISVLAFSLIILSVLWLWESTDYNMRKYLEQSRRLKGLEQASTALVKTPGNPPNWESSPVSLSNVKSLGLAGKDNVLDRAKLESLDDADYETTRKLLALGVQDFRLEVTGNITKDPYTAYDIGQDLGTGEEQVIIRYAVLDGQPAKVKLSGYYTR